MTRRSTGLDYSSGLVTKKREINCALNELLQRASIAVELLQVLFQWLVHPDLPELLYSLRGMLLE